MAAPSVEVATEVTNVEVEQQAAPTVTIGTTVNQVEVTTDQVSVEVQQVTLPAVEVQMAGASGPRGLQGDPGPAGADGTGDLAFSQPFTVSSSVDVVHNLGKYPSVTVIDSAGDEVEGNVDHISTNELIVSFAAAFSGVIHCN